MRRERGVSLLLEAMFGFGLFAVAILVVFALLPSSYQSATTAKNLTLANGIAQEVLERERIQPFPDVISKGRVLFLSAPVSTIDGRVSQVTFNVEVIVSNDPLPGLPLRKHLLVRVDWSDARVLHTVELETYVIET